MRISADKDSYYWHPLAYYHRVFLNDKSLDYCYEADNELGICYCYKTDENGNFILDVKGNKVETEILTGQICIYRDVSLKDYDKYKYYSIKNKIKLNFLDCFGFIFE